ncbi:hypothetical protein MUTS16_32890 [Escherichia coli]|nr:hypothetical protein MUTS16_32890 [Escherichia coli]
MPEININETTPRFEDAFIDLLGGAGTSESPLGAILHTVEGTPGETVIEAKELTKSLAILPPPITSTLPSNAVKSLVCSGQTAQGNRPPLR